MTPRVAGGLLCAFALTAAACSTGSGVRAVEYRDASSTTTTPRTSEPDDAPALPPDRVLAVDGDTRIVTLDNGLTVYLRENDRPGGSVEMRLVVNAGSAMEAPDQYGVAHFLEHMLFNGTDQFPGNDLIDVLRSFGMEFGADVNAYTSYDETVYELHVPVDDRDNIGTGLDVLAQWLSGATITENAVRDERGVVLDEWRLRDQTLDGRRYADLLGLFLAGSGYDGRQPIGEEAAIRGMDADLLRRFYDTWYRPDNAAVVVVGAMDMDRVEDMIRDRFEDLEPRADAGTRPDLTPGPFTAPHTLVTEDPDAAGTVAELTWPLATEGSGGVRALQERIELQVAFSVLANRLGDDLARGLADFTAADAGNNSFVRHLDAPSLWITADVADLDAAVDALLAEFERIRQHGIDPLELERATAPLRAGVEAAYEGRHTRQDRQFAEEYVANFLNGQMIPSANELHRTLTRILDDLTPDSVAARLTERMDHSAPFLYVNVEDGADGVPTEADLTGRLTGMRGLDLPARPPLEPVGDDLMDAPSPVAPMSSDQMADEPFAYLDAHRYLYANGATVVINPTSIIDGEVVIAAWSAGGQSQMAPEDAVYSGYATQVAATSGLGTLDAVQVATVMEASTVELHPYIAPSEEGIWGGMNSADLELALQQIHLWFTAPHFDAPALDALVTADHSFVDDPNADPDYAAWVALQRARYGSDPRFAVLPTGSQLDRLTTATVGRIFRDRFSNASDWVFSISGDIDLRDAEALVDRYLGTLEGDGTQEEYLPVEPPVPAGVVTRTVRAGTGDHASLTLQFEVPSDGSEYETALADLLTNVIDSRLTDHIREELGASYSPYAVVQVDHVVGRVLVYVSVTGDPDGMDELAAAVLADLADLALHGPTATEFDHAMATMAQQYNYVDNGAIAWNLVRVTQEPDFLATIMGALGAVQAVTIDELTAFAARVLPTGQYIQVTQLPR